VQEATEVFVKGLPRGDGEDPKEIVTVDFLRKYLRYCRRLTPKLSEAAQQLVAEKYCDMRMRFQSGYADMNNPNNENRKPKLAVTTRTLEALIRLSTAHAKLKLRREEVLPEDVYEAWKLLLVAREEDVPEPTVPNEIDVPEPLESETTADPEPAKKKARQSETAISSQRYRCLMTLVGRIFATGKVQISREELLTRVNEGLAVGEPAFSAEEFAFGLTKLEVENKVMTISDTDEVMFVG